jgi:hypothetical protein
LITIISEDTAGVIKHLELEYHNNKSREDILELNSAKLISLLEKTLFAVYYITSRAAVAALFVLVLVRSTAVLEEMLVVVVCSGYCRPDTTVGQAKLFSLLT